MADTNGRPEPALIDRLWREPYRFDVRQAVRLLEGLNVSAVPLGAGSDPRREALTLRGSLTSSFPPSDIETLSPGPRGRAELTVTFMSLAGAFGPLPPPLSARITDRLRRRDPAARDFLDLFNHRLLSLMLKQWRLFHPALQGSPADPGMPARLPPLALLGLATLPRAPGPASPEGRLGRTAVSLLGAAGLLNPKPVSAHALERLLAAHFGVPARILPFRGGWLPLVTDQWTHLGQGGQRLGRQAVLGKRVWDQAAGLTVALGPLRRDLFLALLPGGAAHDEAARLLALPLGARFDVELHLRLRAADAPPSRLGAAGPRLGWTSWLGRRTGPATTRVRLGAVPS